MRNFSRGAPCQATHNTIFLACLHKIHNLAAFLKKRPNPPSSYSIQILRANIMICSCNILKTTPKTSIKFHKLNACGCRWFTNAISATNLVIIRTQTFVIVVLSFSIKFRTHCVSVRCFSTNATLDLKKILFQELWTRTFFFLSISAIFFTECGWRVLRVGRARVKKCKAPLFFRVLSRCCPRKKKEGAKEDGDRIERNWWQTDWWDFSCR